MTLTALSAVFSEAPAYPNEAEMDNQMSTNSTQWVILGHAAGNTSKAWGSTPGGERDVPDPSRTHPVTARREDEERKGRIRREERKEDKLRHADIPATRGRRICVGNFRSKLLYLRQASA